MPPKTVFERNIDALKSNKVKYTLVEYNIQKNIKPITTNGYNLLYENKLLHNESSPLGEAKYIFDSTSTNVTDVTIIYGIGLGYLFQYFAQNSQGTVILYEPNIDILKTAFLYVDFSAELVKDNVFVTTDTNALSDIIRNKYNEISQPELICLPSYRDIFKEQIDNDRQEINTIIGGITLDYNYTKNSYGKVAKNILTNIPYLVNEPPLMVLKDYFKGKTAVVCSAGPTLADNIEVLKKYKDNVVIFAVGPAVRSLLNAGITPDFICIIEHKACKNQLANLDVSNSNFILEPPTYYSSHELALERGKQTFLHISSNLPPNEMWGNLCEEDISEYVSKGTVSYCALNSARILGCTRIVLVGQDLAYLDGQVYSRDSIYKDLKLTFNQETQKYEISTDDIEAYTLSLMTRADFEAKVESAKRYIKERNKKITAIKSITGEFIPTEAVYTTFAANIGRYTELYPHLEYINTSMRGALIKGFKNIPLEEALCNTEKIDKVINVIEYSSSKKQMVIDKLLGLIDEFDFVNKKISENNRLLVRFRTEYVRHKSLTKDMLMALRNVIKIYTEISIDFAQKVPLYDFITKKEQMEFESFLQKSDSIDLDVALRLAELQTEYLNASSSNVDRTCKLIKKVVAELEVQ